MSANVPGRIPTRAQEDAAAAGALHRPGGPRGRRGGGRRRVVGAGGEHDEREEGDGARAVHEGHGNAHGGREVVDAAWMPPGRRLDAEEASHGGGIRARLETLVFARTPRNAVLPQAPAV
jgi:hypothetical protein